MERAIQAAITAGAKALRRPCWDGRVKGRATEDEATEELGFRGRWVLYDIWLSLQVRWGVTTDFWEEE